QWRRCRWRAPTGYPVAGSERNQPEAQAREWWLGAIMNDRDAMRQRLKRDGIEFLLVQFVDVHGAAKVKMVPASCLDDVVEAGAGFAGGAVWGAGQGPHSHDMMARA